MSGTHNHKDASSSPPEEARDAAETVARRSRDHADAALGSAQEGLDRFEQSAETAAREAANATSHLRGRAERMVDDVREHASDAYDDVRSWAADRSDERGRRSGRRGFGRLRQGRTATEAFVTDNPLLVGVVGIAAGLLLGALLPRTRREDEAMGPWADEVREQSLRYAREITHRGREYVEAALDTDHLDTTVRRASERHDLHDDGTEHPPQRT